jgi:hypothetical protein
MTVVDMFSLWKLENQFFFVRGPRRQVGIHVSREKVAFEERLLVKSGGRGENKQ